MRHYKGFWFYQGKVYPTLHAALLAVWYRHGFYAETTKNALVSATNTNGGGVERIDRSRFYPL